jgi:glycerophosphoryl diester phosphodiesterase
VGHRSAGRESGLPENSIAALTYCRKLGLWGVECDILGTSDGNVIISHGTSDGSVNGLKVSEHTLSEIRAAGTLSNGEQIPTLEDFIRTVMVEGSTLRLLIDVKTPKVGDVLDTDSPINAVKRACSIISAMDAAKFCIMYSNNETVLGEMLPLCKTYGIAGCTNIWNPSKEKSNGVDYAIRCTATQMVYGPGRPETAKATFEEFESADMPLGVFHVDKEKYNDHSVYDDETVNLYLDNYPSLAFIETNYPKWLVEKLKNKYK